MFSLVYRRDTWDKMAKHHVPVQLFVKRVLFRRLFGNGGGNESGFGTTVVVDGELAARVNAAGTRRFRDVVQRQTTVKDRPRVGINLPTMLQQMLARGRRVQPRVFGQKSTAFGKGLVDAPNLLIVVRLHKEVIVSLTLNA